MRAPASTGHERYLPTPVLGDPRRLEYPWREDYQGERFRMQHPELAKPFVETAAPTQWVHSLDGTPLRLGFCSGLITEVGHSVMSGSFPDYSRPPPRAKDNYAYQALPAEPHREADPAGCPTFGFFRRQANSTYNNSNNSSNGHGHGHAAATDDNVPQQSSRRPSGAGIARATTQRASSVSRPVNNNGNHTHCSNFASGMNTVRSGALGRTATARLPAAAHGHYHGTAALGGAGAHSHCAVPPAAAAAAADANDGSIAVSMPGSKLPGATATAGLLAPLSRTATGRASAAAGAPSASSSAAFAAAVIAQHRAGSGADDTYYRPQSIEQAKATAPALARRAHPSARAFLAPRGVAMRDLNRASGSNPLAAREYNASINANASAMHSSGALDQSGGAGGATAGLNTGAGGFAAPARTALRADAALGGAPLAGTVGSARGLQVGQAAEGSLSGCKRTRLEAATTAYGASFNAPAPGLHYH